jgi:hypothetical protein
LATVDRTVSPVGSEQLQLAILPLVAQLTAYGPEEQPNVASQPLALPVVNPKQVVTSNGGGPMVGMDMGGGVGATTPVHSSKSLTVAPQRSRARLTAPSQSPPFGMKNGVRHCSVLIPSF